MVLTGFYFEVVPPDGLSFKENVTNISLSDVISVKSILIVVIIDIATFWLILNIFKNFLYH